MEEENKEEEPTRKNSSDTAHPADISFNIVQMMAAEETKTQHHQNGTPNAGRMLSKTKYNSSRTAQI